MECPVKVLRDALAFLLLGTGRDDYPEHKLARLDHRVIAVLKQHHPFDAAAGKAGPDLLVQKLLNVLERCLVHGYSHSITTVIRVTQVTTACPSTNASIPGG